MDIRLNEPGFEGQEIVIRTAGLFSKPRVLVKGVPAAGEKGKFIVKDDTGKETVLELKPRYYDIVPEASIGGKKILLAPPMKWYQMTWIGLPAIFLLFGGGALGAVAGVFIFSFSTWLFRTRLFAPLKYLFSILVAAIAWGGFFIAATALNLNIVHAPKWNTCDYKDFRFSIESPYNLTLGPLDESLNNAFTAQMNAANKNKAETNFSLSIESYVLAKGIKIPASRFAEVGFNNYKQSPMNLFPQVDIKNAEFSGMPASFAEGKLWYLGVFPHDYRSISVASGNRMWHVSVIYLSGNKKLKEYADRVLGSLKIKKEKK
jgi:hypothetical protein